MTYEASKPLPHRDLSYYGQEGKVLGRGVYGSVSVYQGPNGEYAVKMSSYEDKDVIDATSLRELACLTRLNHPNVVPVIDIIVDESEKELYMVMPKADSSLNAFLRKDVGVVPANAKSLAYQMLSGVNYCLTRGIINRDIKPDNMLLYGDNLKVADFGLARPAVCSMESGITNEVYTLWYRPPEVLLGGRYDESADIWAVGCVLFELFTGGIVLFSGVNPPAMLIRFMREFGNLKDQWPSVVDLPNWKDTIYENATIPSTIDRLIKDPVVNKMIRGMLEIDPGQRTRLQDVLANPYFDSVRNKFTDIMQRYSCREILEQREQVLDFPRKGTKINDLSIFNLLLWLLDIHKLFRLKPQTFFLAQILLVKYLSVTDISPPWLQLVGCSCLYISCQMIEIYSPELSDIVHVVDNAFTKSQLINQMTLIETTLSFDFVQSTSVDFLNVFISIGSYPDHSKRLSYSLLKFMSIAKGEDKPFVAVYTPQEMALGCLFLTCTYFGCTFKHTALLTPAIQKFVHDFLNYKAPRDFAERFQRHYGTSFKDIQESIAQKSTTVL